MKASATSDPTVGGPHLAAHALKVGLVAECHLFIRPVLVGGGKPALPSDTRVDVELLDDRRLSNGVVYLRYRIPTWASTATNLDGTRSARGPSECDHGGIGTERVAGERGATRFASRLYDRVMSLEWEQTIVDARDPFVLGSWWRDALGWVVINDDPSEFEIRPASDRLPGLLFVRVSESKLTKNRLHLDFRPDDRAMEVERLVMLGATRADIGQGEQSWTVLADPEGNEFCVLGSR